MKKVLILLLAAGVLTAASAPQIITGVITDTMCGAKHDMMKDQPDNECIRVCVKGARDYALYDGTRVWKLSDQKTAARFAARHVQIRGVADEKTMTIKVSSVEAAE